MKFEADVRVPYPRPRVFRAYRDELPEMLDYLPNVKSIEQRDRKESGHTVELFNVWHGGGEIPAAIRKVVGEEMLTWDDYATWNEETHTCDFKIRTHAFTEAVTCSGQNRFQEVDANTTRIEIRGDIQIDASKVKGIPRMFAGSIGKTIEQFLVKRISANLEETARGLSSYLDAQG